MKKKFYMFIFTALLICGFSSLNTRTTMAEEMISPTASPTASPTPTPTIVPEAISITILQYPSKITYEKGESLDLSDLVVQGYFIDGTSAVISDYTVLGYDSNQVGNQTVVIYYQNKIASIGITVIPEKVTNVIVASHDTSSYTLTWDANSSAIRYEIYLIDESTGAASLLTSTSANSFFVNDKPGTIHSYQICAVENVLGIEYKGGFSEVCYAATNPEAVVSLAVSGVTTKSIDLTWSEVAGSTGYLIYRSPASEEEYSLVGTIDALSYTDENLSSGTGYNYIVYAYTLNDNYQGSPSPMVDTSTNPAMIRLKYKLGDEKIRFTWSKVTGATSYDLYMGDDVNGYTLLQTFNGDAAVTYIAEGLVTGSAYEFYALAHREYNGGIYDSPSTDIISVVMEEIEATSTTGKWFKTEAAFYKSWAYLKLTYFSKYVDYSRSYIIPGLETTNVGGFSSKTMCPQGVTFAEDYILVTAYDIAAEENSVIYVMDKETRELLTTLVLSSKPHVGGIAYDGYNVWVTNGSKVSSILFSDIEEAVESGEAYYYVDYNTVCPLGITTSYCTYYDGKLWVGTYNELKATKMYGYEINEIDTAPSLTKVNTIAMPTRVQGVAFTKKGTLILSRSCQLYKGLRGYMRQLDVYKPDFSQAVDGVIPLGDLANSVSMPSMNEGIAVDGAYLYVNFESGAFDKASYKVDRICAFKLTDIATKKS